MKIFVIGGRVRDDETSALSPPSFEFACQEIGKSVATKNHTLLLCSPFEDAADTYVLKGAAATPSGCNTRVEFHFVDTPEVRDKLDEAIATLGLTNVSKVPHPAPLGENARALRYSWLLCQLSALESCNSTIAIGGNLDGSANMLLRLAEGKRKPLLSLPFAGGAAKEAFYRSRYQLEDRLGDKFPLLQEQGVAGIAAELVELMAEGSKMPNITNTASPNVFISYARGRQAEADYVETLLRRRKIPVFRDESEFGAGHDIPAQIKDAIYGATVFIALWSVEYACSPWCYDELELALNQHEERKIQLWILRIDETRMVPTRARNLLSYDAWTRPALEAKVLDLLQRELVTEPAEI